MAEKRPVLLIAKVKGYPWWPARQEDPLKHGITEKKVSRFRTAGPPPHMPASLAGLP